jgi:hypothetical protein
MSRRQKKRKNEEVVASTLLLSQKTIYSPSEKHGLILNLLKKLTSSIASDIANNERC